MRASTHTSTHPHSTGRQSATASAGSSKPTRQSLTSPLLPLLHYLLLLPLPQLHPPSTHPSRRRSATDNACWSKPVRRSVIRTRPPTSPKCFSRELSRPRQSKCATIPLYYFDTRLHESAILYITVKNPAADAELLLHWAESPAPRLVRHDSTMRLCYILLYYYTIPYYTIIYWSEPSRLAADALLSGAESPAAIKVRLCTTTLYYLRRAYHTYLFCLHPNIQPPRPQAPILLCFTRLDYTLLYFSYFYASPSHQISDLSPARKLRYY